MGANFAAPFALLRPVEVDPLKYEEQYANLANLAQLRQYRQQEMAASQQMMQMNAVKLQEAQQGLQDQQTLQTLIPQMRNDPQYQAADGTLDWENKVLPALQGKISQPYYDTLEQNILKNHQTHLTIKKDQADLDQKAQDLAQKQEDLRIRVNDAVANGAIDWRERGSKPEELEGLFQHWEDLYPEAKRPLEDARQHIAANPNMAVGIMAGLERNLSVGGQTARAGLKEKGAETLAKQAQTAKDQAQADLDQLKVNAAKQFASDPQSSLDSIDRMFPNNPEAANVHKIRFQGAMQRGDFDDAKKALEEAGADATKRLQETDPTIMLARAKQAELEARLKGPIEISTGIATAVGREQALAAQAPVGYRGIIDTATRNKAIAEGFKANDEYAKASSEAQQLQDYINAVRSGNQVAMANVPIAVVRSLVNRVNRQELEAQGGQSWARRITDTADKGITGKPSEDTLKDFEGLVQISRNKANTVYAGVADGINAVGGNIPRTPPRQAAPSTPSAQAGAGVKVGQKVTLRNGKTATVTAVYPDGTFDAK